MKTNLSKLSHLSRLSKLSRLLKKSQMFLILLLSVIFVTVVITGCITTKPKEFNAKCITPDYKGFTLSWGYNYEKSPQIMGYQLDENGTLLFYRQDKSSYESPKIFDTLCQIDGEKLCDLLYQLNQNIFKIPVINEPGKELSFIILKKPAVRMLTTAIWNEHKTYGSTGYRELFDSLLAIVPANLKK